MKDRPNTFEEILTPEFARGVMGRLTRRTGTPVFDEDLIQEALLRGLLAFRRIPDIRYPRAFLTKIIRDLVIDDWRHGRYTRESLSEDQGSILPTVESDIDRQRRFTQLGRALSLLATHDREIIEMYYLHEASIAEIADTFNRSRSAVKMILLRSRRVLRGLLNIQSV